MKELIMTIGLPFSGKSKAVKELAAKGYEVIERDPLLQEIIASSAFKEAVQKEGVGLQGRELFALKNRLAIEMLSARVRELVQKSLGEKIVYDGTNLQKASRAGVLALRDEGVRLKAIVFDVPLEEILRRAEAVSKSGERKGAFNESAIRSLSKMIGMTEDPSMDEGFVEIEVRRFEPENREGQEQREMHRPQKKL